MEADFEVREDGELRARLRVALETPVLVARERLAQVALSLGRVAGPQRVEETPEWRGLDRRVRRTLVEVTRELQADLLEHPQVPVRDGGARTLERIERRVQCTRQAPDPRLALEEAVAQQPTPQRRNWMQKPASVTEVALEVLEQVLTTDRPTRLSGGPRCICAPVRALTVSCCERLGETRVAVRDLEVSDDRVRDRGDPFDLVHARQRRRWIRVRFHGSSVSAAA